MNRPMTWIIVAAGLPVVMLFSLAVGLMLLVTSSASACNPSSSISGPAVSVDPKNVPKGPVGGYSGVQLVNAAIIMVAIKDLGMSARDQRIAVMVAMGESQLQVIDYGDAAGPDSRGLFQQRDNGAWGSYSDRMDPYISATNFGKALKQVSDRDSREPTLVAHEVQRNQDPYYHGQYWDRAGEVVDALVGIPASRSGGAATVAPVGNQNRTKVYDVGPVEPVTQTIADTLAPMFGFDPPDVGGKYPWSYLDHGRGMALDFMTYEDQAKGQRLVDYLIANSDTIGVKYINWLHRIWQNGNWSWMADRGNPTDNHMDHVHLSIADDAPLMNGAPAGGSCASTGAIGPGGWTKPIGGELDNDYGWRMHPVYHVMKHHDGIDVGNGCGDDIFAVNSGLVTYAGPDGGYGNQIRVDHGGGIVSRYSHMYSDGMLVKAGDQVTSGQHIGEIGSAGTSTACHLHFEIQIKGEFTNPYEFLTERLPNI